jgi:hypothetical protein
MPNWYRVGVSRDFFVRYKFNFNRVVEFENLSQWEAVKGISVDFNICGELKIDVNFASVFKRGKINQAISKWISQHGQCTGIQCQETVGGNRFITYKILLETSEAISLFPEMLRFINLQLKEDIFSADIIMELEAITACSLEWRKFDNIDQCVFNHRIPMLPDMIDCYNPKSRNCTELSTLLSGLVGNTCPPNEQFYEKLESYLARGDDPNQFGENTSWTPLYYAMWSADTEIFSMILHYHGDPFSRIGNGYSSALDIALGYGHTRIVNVIKEKYAQPERPVSLMIKQIDVNYQSGKLTTSIDWHRANDPMKNTVASVVTEVKRTVDDIEEQEIVALSHATFEMPNDPQQVRLTESIKGDLHKENQLVEVIRSQGKVVGFNIFEIVSHEKSNKIYFTCNWSLIGPEFSQTDMMPMLIKRHALTLLQLNPDKVVVFGFLAADINSYRLADDIHFPKYQADGMAEEARWYHQSLCQRPDEVLHHRGLVCYVENQVMVKKRGSAPKQSYQSRFFHRHVLDQGDAFSADHKAALVFSYVADSFYRSLQKNCQRIGINLDAHLRSLSCLMEGLLAGFPQQVVARAPVVSKNYLCDARHLFWLNIKVKSNQHNQHNSMKLPAKL